MIYQPADLRPKTLKTAVSGFFLLISVAYLERYLMAFWAFCNLKKKMGIWLHWHPENGHFAIFLKINNNK